MFGIGTTEVLLILVVALLVIGPSKLPDVARALGKGMAEFRRMSSDVKKTIDMEAQLADMEQESKKQDATTGQPQGQTASSRTAEDPKARSETDQEPDAGSVAPSDQVEPDAGPEAASSEPEDESPEKDDKQGVRHA